MAVTIVRTTSATQLNALLSQASASTTYLTKASASTTYLTQTSASTTYLAQAPGIISQYIGVTAPSGYLLCDGSPVSRTTYSALWDVLRNGTSSSPYGDGNGTTTFNLPNLQGRVPVGIDTTQTEFDTRGETGGSKTSTAPHTHGLASHTHSTTHDHGAFGTSDGTGGHDHQINTAIEIAGSLANSTEINWLVNAKSTGANYQTTDSDGAHNHTIDVPSSSNTSDGPSNNTSDQSSASASSGNLQPYITVNFIIKT
jgi:microcystin-dependent protein